MKNKKIFITGGAGYLGKNLVRRYYKDNEITVYSRDEAKHYYLKKEFPSIKCVIGDIRNYDLLKRASAGHDIGIFAASLKQIGAVDQNVEESISFQSQEENKLNEAKEIIDERLERIKKATQKLRSPLGLNEMENVPAYKRRNIELDDVNPSSESEVSKYTLWESEDDNGEKRTGLSDNNSFLHDNVD